MEQWIQDRISPNIGEQVLLLSVSLLAGVLIGIVYDGFRGWRRMCALRCRLCNRGMEAIPAQARQEKKMSELAVHIEDVMFWIFYVVITYYIFYRYHYGVPAGYVFLSQGIGLYLYYKIVKNWVRCLFTCVFWNIVTIFSYIYTIIGIPFRVICGNFRNLLKSIVKSIKIVFIND